MTMRGARVSPRALALTRALRGGEHHDARDGAGAIDELGRRQGLAMWDGALTKRAEVRRAFERLPPQAELVIRTVRVDARDDRVEVADPRDRVVAHVPHQPDPPARCADAVA